MEAKVSMARDVADPHDGDAGTGIRRVSLDIVPPVPAEVPVAVSVSFKVRVWCADADLRGAHVEVIASDHVVATPALIEHRDGCSETAAIAVRAPAQLGVYGLTVVFPRQQIGGHVYDESTLPISFQTVSHKTSLAAWDVPSPVRTGGRFSVKAGVKSSGACELDGARVEVLDETGAAVGHGTLGGAPWPGTRLYWAEIELTAPPREGTFSWRVAFPAQQLKLAHDASAVAFSFVAVPPPAHRLTLKVVECEAAAPLGGVEIALGPYRASTDTAGVAQLELPAGQFSLAVWKSEFEFIPRDVDVAGDVSLQVEMKRIPQEPAIWDELA